MCLILPPLPAVCTAGIVRSVWQPGKYTVEVPIEGELVPRPPPLQLGNKATLENALSVWRTCSIYSRVIYRTCVVLFFLQLLYILGVYWVGPDIASAFQVHTACDLIPP